MISKKQLNLFWRMFARVVADVCPGSSKADQDKYRHKLIYKACKKTSVKDLSNTDFEKVMTTLAVEIGDFEEASYWGFSRDRRLLEMCRSCARQIGEITDRELDETYFKELFHRPFIAWERIPSEDILTVFQMLDTHRRRLLKRAGWGGGDPSRPLAFVSERCYFNDLDGQVRYHDPTSVSDYD